MVMKTRTHGEVIADLAGRIAARVPFVALPSGIQDLDGLMRFDKSTCQTFRQFVRPLHRADLPPDAPADVVIEGGTVIVTLLAPGVRSRVVTESRRT